MSRATMTECRGHTRAVEGRGTPRKAGGLVTAWRFLVALFYLGSAVFNLLVTFADPEPVYSAFAVLAWPGAETLVHSLVLPVAGVFTLAVVVFELATGLLILHRGRAVRWGLAAAVAWLVALIPFLGWYGLVNVVFVLTILPLFSRDHERSLVDFRPRRVGSIRPQSGIRIVGIFQVTVGVGVAGWWVVALATGSVPEIEAGDAAIWFHLAAEWLMALLLITGGWLLVRSSGRRGLGVSALASGSLIYSAVNSAGYFAEAGDWPLVGFFTTILVLTMAAVVLLLPEVGAGRSIERHPR